MDENNWFQQNAPESPQGAPATGGGWFQQNAPSSAPAAKAAPPTMPVHDALTDNAAGEGVYQMTDPKGTAFAIPYSKVDQAHRLGYNFADQQHRTQYARDFAADPIHEGMIDHYLKNSPWWDPAANAIGIMEGVGSGAEGTLAGLDRIAHKVTGERPNKGDEAFQTEAAKPNPRASSAIGEMAEATGEFFTGEELLSLLGRGGAAAGTADKLAQAGSVAKVLRTNPAIAKLLKIGASAVRNFSITGAQTFAKTGGDTGAALETGAAGAGIGAVGEAALGGASKWIGNRATTTENVGGVEMPVSAEARNNTPTPEQAAGQQAIRNAAKNSARTHLEEAQQTRETPAGPLQLPPSTGPYTFELQGQPPAEGAEGPNLFDPRKKQIGTQVVERTPRAEGPDARDLGASLERPPQHGTDIRDIDPATGQGPQPQSPVSTDASRLVRQPKFQYMSDVKPGSPEARSDIASGAGTLRTTDPNVAEAHLRALNDITTSPEFGQMPQAQKADIFAARRDAMRQLAEYREHVLINSPGYVKPNIEPIDIPKTLSRIGSYTDAANELEKVATNGYEFMNQVTGGRFSAIRQANKDAWREMTAASGQDALAAAEKKLDASNRAMDGLIGELRGVVSDRELDGFNDAYRHAQGMRQVARVVDGSFTGNPSSSARSWEYRGFNGQQLMSGLSRVEQRMGRPAMTRLLGRDNLDTLYQVAELNRTQAQRAKFGANVVKPIATALFHAGPIAMGGAVGKMTGIGWEWGAAAGVAASVAAKRVMDSILTNPQIARNVIFALDSGAKPENYGPFIAGLIQKAQAEGEDNGE